MRIIGPSWARAAATGARLLVTSESVLIAAQRARKERLAAGRAFMRQAPLHRRPRPLEDKPIAHLADLVSGAAPPPSATRARRRAGDLGRVGFSRDLGR